MRLVRVRAQPREGTSPGGDHACAGTVTSPAGWLGADRGAWSFEDWLGDKPRSRASVIVAGQEDVEV